MKSGIGIEALVSVRRLTLNHECEFACVHCWFYRPEKFINATQNSVHMNLESAKALNIL